MKKKQVSQVSKQKRRQHRQRRGKGFSLNQLSLKRQLIVMLLLTSILPAIVITNTLADALGRQIEKTVGGYSKKIVMQLNYNVEAAVESCKITIADLVINDGITRFVKEYDKLPTYDRLVYTKEIDSRISSMFNTQSAITGIEIIKDDQEIYCSSREGGQARLREIIDSDYYNQMKTLTKSEFLWSVVLEENEKGNQVSSIYVGKKFVGKHSLCIFELDSSYFQEILELASINEDLPMMILDETGNIIFSNNRTYGIGNNVSNEGFMQLVKAQDEATLEYDNHLLSFCKVSNGWCIVSYAPIKLLKQDIVQVMYNIMVFLGVFVLLICIIGIIVFYRMAKPLECISECMQQVEKGNLDIEDKLKHIHGTNLEVAILLQGFKNMVHTLKGMLTTTAHTTDEVEQQAIVLQKAVEETIDSAEEIERAIEGVAEGAQQQTKEIENSVALIAHLSNHMNTAGEVMNQVRVKSKETMKMSEASTIQLEQLVKQSQDVNRMSKAVSDQVEELGKEADDIHRILHMLEEINSQTTLLSFNAAIEAARAGEAGRGFSIVADEVRKLASATQESIKVIGETLNRIDRTKEETLKQLKAARAVFKEQEPIVVATKGTFMSIYEQMRVVDDEFEKVNTLFKEVDTEKEDINKRIKDIMMIVEQTAATAEEVSAASMQQTTVVEGINEIANTLKDTVDQLEESCNQFSINKP